MTTAKIFMSGNSQAVRLPKEFRFEAEEVDIYRRGDEVVLRERKPNMARALELILQLPEDFLADLNDPPPQEREGL